MTPDDDPTTAEITVVSASERVIVSRCVGPTLSFQERSYILIDDIARSPVETPDGTASTYPSFFVQPELR